MVYFFQQLKKRKKISALWNQIELNAAILNVSATKNGN